MTMAPGKVDGNGARKSVVVGVEVDDQEHLLSSAMAPEKVLDTCRSHVRWETPRGRYDECSSKFSLKKTKVIEPVGLETAPAHNTTKKLCPNVTVRLSVSPAC